jgi:hypothetical protein
MTCIVTVGEQKSDQPRSAAASGATRHLVAPRATTARLLAKPALRNPGLMYLTATPAAPAAPSAFAAVRPAAPTAHAPTATATGTAAIPCGLGCYGRSSAVEAPESLTCVVGPVGLEPTTYGLKVRSSAIELEARGGRIERSTPPPRLAVGSSSICAYPNPLARGRGRTANQGFGCPCSDDGRDHEHASGRSKSSREAE